MLLRLSALAALASAARPARVIGRRPLAGVAAAVAFPANANPPRVDTDRVAAPSLRQAGAPPPVDADRVAAPALPQSQPRGLVLKNGLKFTDGAVGAGAKLSWGQVVKIRYVAYWREGTGAKLVRYDDSEDYLVRHGNGRDVRGLDEGLHTMRVGGTRRIEVPPALGYTAPGLGPMPESAQGRRVLDRAIGAMEGKQGSAVVYDVAVLEAWTDDADMGYYQDESFSGDELRIIVEKAQKIGRGLATAAGEAPSPKMTESPPGLSFVPR